MSKIDDAIFEIKQYLSGNDHCDNPRIRHAAAIYAQACQEINSKLAECRKLIQRGLLLDAQRLNAELQPSLSERAEKLILPPDLSAHFRELCSLYDYPSAPEISINVLDQLKQTPCGKEEILQELILRWRKIARTGSNPEKMKLLRLIINNAPADDQIWRSNLMSVENQYINDLQKAAESAIQENAGEKVAQIYMALTDPQLTKKVPESFLSKLQPYVRKHQQQLLAQDLEKKRVALFNAYSAQNVDLITELLKEYDMMLTNPLYSADPGSEQAVGEVRKYLQEELSRRQTERFYDEKLSELISQLDKHGDYPIIENLYESLRKTDIPLDRRISQRVLNRREEHLEELNRKHVRKCIYCALGAFAVLLLAIFAFHIIQSTRTFLSYKKSMEQLLANGNNAGVLKLHDDIKKKNPILLQFGNLTALRLDAEKAMTEEKSQIQKLSDLLSAAENLLASASANTQELKQLQQSTANIKIKNMPPELADRLQKVNFAIRRLSFNTQQKLDNDYINQHKKYLEELADCRKMLADNSVAPEKIQKRIANIMSNMQSLTDNAGQVTANIRITRNAMIQEQGKSLLNELKNIQSRRQLLAALHTPKNFVQYSRALQNLPAAAPDLAMNQWNKALNALATFNSLASGADLPISSSHAELEKAISEQQSHIAGNSFVRDLTRILPDKYFNEKFNNAVTQLQTELSALYDCYELAFSDAENNSWHFYSAEKPQIDKRRSSRVPKALAVSVMLSPGSEGEFLPLRIERSKNGNFRFIPGKFKSMALPDAFTELKNMPVTSADFPKSQQSIMLNEILRVLKRCQTPEQLTSSTADLLDKLLRAGNMNTVVKAYLVRRLLDIYAMPSEFTLAAVNKYILELDNTAQKLYSKWYIPTIHAEHPDTVKKLNHFFKNFSSAKLTKTVQLSEELHKLALSRGLTPGGIVLTDQNNVSKLHWFDGMESMNELWFCKTDSENKQAVWTALDKTHNIDTQTNSLKNHNLHLFHGELFFVPFDNRNTAQLAQKIKDDARTQGVNVIVWPDTWPQNKR